MLSPGVKAALADCEIGHRDTRFSQLVTRVRATAATSSALEMHSILFIGGPATAAIEAVCASLVPPDARVLVPVNGSFGARIAEILNVYQIPHTAIDFVRCKPSIWIASRRSLRKSASAGSLRWR